MAKQVKISTSWSVTGGIMSITVETRALDATKDAAPLAKFSRSLTLNELFPGYSSLTEIGIQAVEFGVFTRIRNSLGSAETFEEAEEAVDRILSAFASGEWGADREQSTIPFSAAHILALAVERATSGAQDAATAASKLCELAEATCSANGKPTFAALEPEDRAKIRKAVVDHIKKTKPAIAAALSAIEGERALLALQRKQEAAAKALAAAGNDENVGL